MDWQPEVKVRGQLSANFRHIWNTLFGLLATGCRSAEVPAREPFAHRAVTHRWMMKWKAEGV